MEEERVEGLVARAEEAAEGAAAQVAAQGGEGATVVGEPEKPLSETVNSTPC